MPVKAFLDTNILIYAVVRDERSARAEKLLADGGVVSVQVLNEFVSIARRKLKMPWPQVTDALDAIRVLCPEPVAISVETHKAALEIAQKHRYEIYDALVIAAALQAKCAILYSEDLHHGQVIGGRIEVRNPFRS
jgi:predicted nucleic acid-binding protein